MVLCWFTMSNMKINLNNNILLSTPLKAQITTLINELESHKNDAL